MKHDNDIVNPEVSATATIAPLKNVALCSRALDQICNRPTHLPGMAVFFGPSGYGKSFGASYAANKTRAYYIAAKSTWCKSDILEAILKEMGITPEKKKLSTMTEQIAEQLVKSRRPLIIDETDHIVNKKAIEVVRDIYDSSNAPILLIGEENIELKLKQTERFHNRILVWQPAQPSDMKDTENLAKLYCREVVIEQDLLKRIQSVSRGVTRRICVNLYNVQETAMRDGLSRIDLATWGDRELYTGAAPRRKI